MDLTTLWAWAGQFGITLVGGVGVAYAAFRYLGDKWITNQFNKQLEEFKGEQQQALEHLKLKINTTFDRAVKLHTQEFEVLPEIWQLLTDTFHHTKSVLHFYQEYPDLDRMNPQELDHFLGQTNLPLFQQEDIKGADRKVDLYREIISWRQLAIAEQKRLDHAKYFHTKRIFVDTEIKEKITDLNNIIARAILERRIQLEHNNIRGEAPRREQFEAEAENLHKSIGDAIQARLSSVTLV